MAREHVYPVCGNGLKTISFVDLEMTLDESDVSSSSFNFYRNEDQSISIRKKVSDSKVINLVISGGKDGITDQILIDLKDSDLPSGFLDSIDAVPYSASSFSLDVRSYFIYSLGIRTGPESFLGYVPLPLKNLPTPGAIICIAAKNFKQSSDDTDPERTNDLHSVYPYDFPGTEDKPHSRGLFRDQPPYVYADVLNLDSVGLKIGQWYTLMYTGTRFVLLGSNNWV